VNLQNPFSVTAAEVQVLVSFSRLRVLPVEVLVVVEHQLERVPAETYFSRSPETEGTQYLQFPVVSEEPQQSVAER
jgi:hypothetical protein